MKMDEVELFVRAALADVALVIGSAAALHHLDDDLVWTVMKRLDSIRVRLLRELKGLAPRGEYEPGEARPPRIHAAVDAFLVRNRDGIGEWAMPRRRDPSHSHTRESALVSAIIEALRAAPGLVVRKRHGTAWGVAGDPDLTGCYRGRHFELEVKTPAGVLTRLQEARLAEWSRAGAITAVVRSVGEALAALGIEEGK